MNQFYTGRVNEDDVIKDMQRRSAVRHHGYSFIVLELIDMRKARVSGVEDLKGVQGDRPGKYVFEPIQKHLEFSVDVSKGGMLTAYVLDTPNNRKFLASHIDCEYWEVIEYITGRKKDKIEYEDVIEELYELKDKLAEESRIYNEKNRERLQRIKRDSISRAGREDLLPKEMVSVESMTEEDLEKALARKRSLNQIDIKASIPQKSAAQQSFEDEFKKQQAKAKAKAAKEFEVDINISQEDFNLLTSGQKAKVTKARNLAKRQPQIIVSSKPDDIVVSKKSEPDSAFLITPNKSPVGMVQP